MHRPKYTKYAKYNCIYTLQLTQSIGGNVDGFTSLFDKFTSVKKPISIVLVVALILFVAASLIQ